MLTVLLSLLCSPAHAEDVLVIYDSPNQGTPALVAALEDAGLTVRLSDVPEWQWDGTNPSLDGIGAVIHLDGAEGEEIDGVRTPDAWNLAMPTAGQQALAAFVRSGGGFIHQEWLAYERSTHSDLDGLILLQRQGGGEGELTVNLASAHLDHPVLAGLPASFTFNSGYNVGGVIGSEVDPVTVLAADGFGWAAVAVRDLGAGRVVGFQHTGNYQQYDTLLDANVQLLYINAVLWSGRRCDADADGVERLACGGTDCDDARADVYPGADERCDGADHDCDGTVEGPDPVDGDTFYTDADGDGFGGDGATMLACDLPDGMSDNDTDCDDSDAASFPGGTEVPYDDIDQDCDGSDLVDVDGDGVSYPEDCNDDDAAVFPGAEEIKGDDIDNDCDEKIDGCSCATGPQGALGLLPLLLGLVVLRRRR